MRGAEESHDGYLGRRFGDMIGLGDSRARVCGPRRFHRVARDAVSDWPPREALLTSGLQSAR
jgi:hypothetical protein